MKKCVDSAQRSLPAVWLLAAVLCCAGCHRDMHDQPRYETFEPSGFFADGMSARPYIAGTIARGQLREHEAFFSGKREGEFVTEIPHKDSPDEPREIDRAFLERGQERYEIYCAVCHAPTGSGNGMIVQRGFRRPPSFHIERLRQAPVGHYFDVMTHGFGAMPSYAVQIKPDDRWAIVAYIRVLQLSQNASVEHVPAEELARLKEAPP